MTLDELAVKYGTDKSSKGHSYCQYYEIFFNPIRHRRVNLLEIGIDKGDSLRMWEHYFYNQKSDIHGIDIRDGYGYLGEQITTHVLDHSNKADLLMFGMEHDKYFDVIVDDGSHMSSDSILTFETLFPYMRHGGFYCIEDMLCDYDPRWNKGESSLDRIRKTVGEVNMNGRVSNDDICANKIEAVKKYAGTYFENHIEFVFISMGLCIIKKL